MGTTTLLAPVRYVLSCSSEHVPELRVRRFALREALSELDEWTVEAATADEAELDELLGASCSLTIARGEGGRRVHGVVTRVERLAAAAGRARVRLTGRPALALLGQRVCTRFWQGLRAPEIVQAVLREPLQALGRSIRLELEVGEYPVREYCVQYRESDLEFARRLLQEEGIAFSFDHSGDHEVLVLHDTTTRAQDLEVPPIPVVARGTAAAAEQSIDEFSPTRELGPSAVVRREWDFRDPEGRPRTRERRTAGEGGEVYVHEEGGVRGDDGERQARQALESLTWPCAQVKGSSDVVELAPGRCFAVAGRPASERYLVIAAEHSGEAPEALLHGGGEGPRYVNRFVCIPAEVPFRARARERARVFGPHTAIVVGPPGEEIHTDEFGRIKVRFHWDRESPADDRASCWIRVAQSWAGAGWGAQFVPRVGTEVVVEFLDGDPDRPLVTGCVYNAGSRPPFALPEQKTRSGVRSDVTPGGGGHNEICFEDAKGREQLRVHAQRDLHEVVRNRHTQRVYGDQEVEVRGAQAVTIREARAVEVQEGDDALVVAKGSRSAKIHGSDASTVETGDLRVTVEQGTFALTAGTAVELTAREAWLSLQATRTATLESIAAGVGVKGKETIAVVSSRGGVNVQGDEAVTLRSVAATAKVTAPKKVSLESEHAVALEGGEEVEVTAPKVTLRADAELSLVVGATTITLRPEGITISGPKITSKAIGVHEIVGGLVKIN